MIFYVMMSCTSISSDKVSSQNILIELLPKVLDDVIMEKNLKNMNLGYNVIREDDIIFNTVIAEHLTNVKNDTIIELIKGLNSLPKKFDVSDLDKIKINNGLTLCTTKSSINNAIKSDSSLFGLIDISDIYFSSQYKKGIFYVYYQCGKKCGAAYMIFLKLENSKWIYDKKVYVAG